MVALNQMGAPSYILRLIASYIKERSLTYSTDDSERTYKVTTGVLQGSVLGPPLWNIMYEGVVRLPVLNGVKIRGFADDQAGVVVGKTLEEVKLLENSTIQPIHGWLKSMDLQLAYHKAEAVLVSSRKNL